LRKQALNYEPSLICDSVGIDFGCGLRNSLVLSDGIVISLTSQIYINTAKLDYFNYLYDNKENKNSGKSKRLKIKINDLEKHIVGIRENWTHKVSKWLAQTYTNIAIEDFGSASIVEGNNLNNINRQVYNAAFGSIKSKIAYKCNIQGKNSKLIKPHYTSQICSNPNCNCNYKNFEKKTLDQRLHLCVDCQLAINRDLNASISVLRLSKFRAVDTAFEIKFNSIKEILSSE
jgi:putative transposase